MALRLALDTNRFSDLCRGDTELELLVERAEAVFLPFVTVAELRAGFSLGTKGRENEKVLQRFLAKPGVAILWPTEATTRQYAALYRQLWEQRTPIPTNDLWIAALVSEHGLVLCDRDRHFDALPQLERV
ncbi:MAG: type II toxin-antitoxin system VapC family toxin [Acidobacteriota bacterium]